MSSVDEPVRTKALQTAPNTSLSAEELQWGQYCHFAGVFGVIGTLVCWLMKKDTSPYVDRQGKTAVNFHLTNVIIAAICAVTIIGIPIALLISPYSIIMAILTGMKAKDGQIPKYPFSWNLIK
jgi:uncharacterized Tic20 family protein